jgi:uncharacterized membrane protein (DUF2068 family)
MSKHFPNSDECPPEEEHRRHIAGLRMVASLELLKGILVLAGGFGLFALRHKDIGDLAESFIERLHLNPAHHFVQLFIQAADRISDRRVVELAFAAFAYAILRFFEGYGLWHARAWAEWLAIISGALYLPLEIMGVVKHDDRVRWALLIINIVVVVYMIHVRWDAIKAHRAANFAARSGPLTRISPAGTAPK